MEIAPFGLERWFARYEHEADIMLAESGIRSLQASRFDTDPGELGYVIPTNGDPALRSRVAERYGRGPDEVVFTVGTQEANLLAVLALMDRDDHAVVITPTYQSLVSLPAAIGSVSRVELSPPDWRLDPDAVASAVRPETTLVIFANPNNPTGRYHSWDAVRSLYSVADDADAYLLCDEVYRLLADEPLPPVATLGDRGLSTTSLTKAWGLAGARFGWLAGPRSVVEATWRWKDYTTVSPSPFGQHLARQVFDDEEAILAENRALARTNRERTRAFVREHGMAWHEPVGVNGFPTVPAGFADAREFCTAVVEEASVVLAPGDVFGQPDRFRLGFGLETEALEEGLRRVGEVIDGRS